MRVQQKREMVKTTFLAEILSMLGFSESPLDKSVARIQQTDVKKALANDWAAIGQDAHRALERLKSYQTALAHASQLKQNVDRPAAKLVKKRPTEPRPAAGEAVAPAHPNFNKRGNRGATQHHKRGLHHTAAAASHPKKLSGNKP